MSGNEKEKEKEVSLWEGLIKSPQSSLKALFTPNNNSNSNNGDQHSHIPYLSPLANSILSRSSRILDISIEQLQNQFGLPENHVDLLIHSRNFIEFFSFKALHAFTRTSPEFLSDQQFRRFTFDIMLAWEFPIAPTTKPTQNQQEEEEEDGWSFFISTQNEDVKSTVGAEAFCRIAPCSMAVADIITVHNLFRALTVSSNNRLHFLSYDKYIKTLHKVIKAAKNTSVASVTNLQLAEGEFVLDVDGSVPLQPILQHIGLSAWPGRLTLTNYALYFESLGVGVYDKAVKYDLATDLKQVIKPELTGPLGARVFDKAVMYKSTSIAEPVYLEFTELKGNSRRDYWLDICLEILYVHKFIRKNKLQNIQKSEILARAILGIFRYRAVREAFQYSSSQYKSLLPFNLAESLPGGDLILETLLSQLVLLNESNVSGSPYAKQERKLSPVSLLTLHRFGFVLQSDLKVDEAETLVGDVSVGEVSPLEMAVKQSLSDTYNAEAAQATVDQVKVEGIDTNVAVMKELLFPAIEITNRLQILSSWEDPYKSTVFLALICWSLISGWIRYLLPLLFLFFAFLLLWRKHFNKGKPLEPLKITAPPTQNAVEQLLTLQDAISQIESLIQYGNIVLLKIRALLFAVFPQATERVAILLVVLAVIFAFVPWRYIAMVIFVEGFTREMPYRKESSNKVVRRIREWWIRIPAAPVQLVKPDVKKKKKA